MDRDRVNKIVAEAKAAEEAGNPAEVKRIMTEAIAEAAEEGNIMDAQQIEAIADYVTKSVHIALGEPVATARKMGSDVVPVGFIEEVMKLPATGAMRLWTTVEELNVPIDYGVPDDLSGLEDL